MKTAFLLWLGLATGNFIYQAIIGKKTGVKPANYPFFRLSLFSLLG